MASHVKVTRVDSSDPDCGNDRDTQTDCSRQTGRCDAFRWGTIGQGLHSPQAGGKQVTMHVIQAMNAEGR